MRKPLDDEAVKLFTRWQRFKIFLLQGFGYFLVWFIGRTLRFQIQGMENWEELKQQGHSIILVFWHGRILPATWFFRKRGIVVMTSMNFDGEYIARFIQMHGYGTARGSSSRGGMRALAEMVKAIRKGKDAGFTVDGPRGPRYLAKIGPILLAKKTGAPIVCFHISCQWKLELNSWDHFQVPMPFSRALLLMESPIWVSKDADEEEQRSKHKEMQKILDNLRIHGDLYWSK